MIRFKLALRWASMAASNEEAMIRTQQWKFVIETYYKTYLPSFRTETHFNYPGLLFDMARDPGEMFSMTRDNPQIVEEMNAFFEKGQRELVEPHAGFDSRNIAPAGN